MNLQFTGIGAAYYPILGSNCAFFTHQDRLYLIDCGESTFRTMYARKEIFQYEKITVLLTHLHADHIGSLGSFLSFCKNELHKTVTLAAQETTIVNILAQSGVGPDMYDFTTDFSRCGTESLSILPQSQCHADDMLCCGFVFAEQDERTYFSGDAASLPQPILEEFLSGRIKTMYHECTYLTRESSAHCSLEKLKAWIPEKQRSRVFCMHLGEADLKEEILAAGFRVPVVV